MEYLILKAESEIEKSEIYKFRYSVYVEELNKYHIPANHEEKLMYTKSDRYAVLYYAKANDKIIATVRSHRGVDGPFQLDEVNYFKIDIFKIHFSFNELAIVNKLIVDKHYRNTRLTHLMILETYLGGLEVGTKLCFITCEERLLPMYLRYGFRIYDEPILIENEIKRFKLILCLCDREYLLKVKSPFVKYLPQNSDDNGLYSDKIKLLFPNFSS
jgi:hypothetical protein